MLPLSQPLRLPEICMQSIHKRSLLILSDSKRCHLTTSSPRLWKRLQPCPNTTPQAFSLQEWDAQEPILLSSIHLPAAQSWVSSADATLLNHDHLAPHADTTYLPMELSSPDPASFQRVSAAPLSLFLHYAALSPAERDGRRLYIAQAGLDLLPEKLRFDFPIPSLLGEAERRSVYSTSLWMGLGGSATPLHRDPNHNLLVQVAGRKRARFLNPREGASLLEKVRRQGGRAQGITDRVRGDEMMRDEMSGLEKAVWEDQHPDAAVWKATLGPGNGLLIPQGWFHAIRSAGEEVNISVSSLPYAR